VHGEERAEFLQQLPDGHSALCDTYRLGEIRVAPENRRNVTFLARFGKHRCSRKEAKCRNYPDQK
jgi:hypothetical protein